MSSQFSKSSETPEYNFLPPEDAFPDYDFPSPKEIVPELSFPPPEEEESPPLKTTIFQTEVPYRVSQILPTLIILLRDCNDDFDLSAPKVLAIKDVSIFTSPTYANLSALSFGDLIKVKKYQSKTAISSSDKILFKKEKKKLYFVFEGVVTLAEHFSSLIRCWDFSYISKIDGSTDFWIVDRKKFTYKRVMKKIINNIPQEFRKLLTRLYCEYIKFPSGTFFNFSSSSIIMLPSVLKFSAQEFSSTLPAEDFVVSVKLVENLKTPKDLSEDCIALYASLFCMFTKDKNERIEKAELDWDISDNGYAQVRYERFDETYYGDHSSNCKNSLFRKKSIAMLKRHDPESGKKSIEEIYVKINESEFEDKEIKIGFKVGIENLIKEWKLESVKDFETAKYTLEPTDIFAHWRPFIEKLVAEEKYLENVLNNSKPLRAAILDAFMPEGKSNMQIFQFPDAKAEEEADANFRRRSQLPYAHCIARDECVSGKPIVIIDGAVRTGKTTLNTFIIPDILKTNLRLETSTTVKCLALVSPVEKTLQTQFKLIQESDGYRSIKNDVQVLNLLDFDNPKKGSFLKILEDIIYKYNPFDEDKTKLVAAIKLLKTKRCASYRENKDGFERDIITPRLSTEEKKALEDSAEAYVDIITTKELFIFQDAITVIFNYYRPNFVIASNETFISLLPSVAGFISHIAVDEAGRMPFIEGLMMVAELPNLEQLILIGDTTAYPYYHRAKFEKRPPCFDNIMKVINQKSPELSYIQLNKVFGMHPKLLKIINNIFYPCRNLIPLFPPRPTNLNNLQNPLMPICFHDVDGIDEHIPPTTRRNFHQNYIGMQILLQLSRQPNNRDQKILILCNYRAEREMFENKLSKMKLDLRVSVKCVDNALGEHADIVIYITTRAVDKEKQEIVDLFKCRNWGWEELGKLHDNYHYVFDQQRIQTALSRASKAVFIVGSQELLEHCPLWENLIDKIHFFNYFSHPNIIKQLPYQRRKETDRKRKAESPAESGKAKKARM